MQTTRIVQAVVLMSVVALAASCAASKDYTSKLFAPRVPVAKDSQVLALRFLDIDSAEKNTDDWVTTDIIMGRDTVSKTLTLDNFSKVFPAAPVKIDTANKTVAAKTTPDPVAKKVPVPVKTEPVPVETEPVAKIYNPGEVREKKTRE